MRNILENYTPESNFWEINPQFTVINPLRQLWKSDKSRNKTTSSNLMWAIAFIHHPKSDLYHVSNKSELIAKDLLNIKDKDIDKFWKDNEKYVEAFVDAALTQAEKSLSDWFGYMQGRDKYLKSVKYYFDEYKTDDNGDNIYSKTGNFILVKGTADQLDKAWGASKSMWADYEKIKKSLDEEDVIKKNAKIKSDTATGDI